VMQTMVGGLSERSCHDKPHNGPFTTRTAKSPPRVELPADAPSPRLLNKRMDPSAVPTARSSLPSRSKSAARMEMGGCWPRSSTRGVRKPPAPSPKSTDTDLDLVLAVATSTCPSLFRSPTASCRHAGHQV
jgi:hypothetical protein